MYMSSFFFFFLRKELVYLSKQNSTTEQSKETPAEIQQRTQAHTGEHFRPRQQLRHAAPSVLRHGHGRKTGTQKRPLYLHKPSPKGFEYRKCARHKGRELKTGSRTAAGRNPGSAGQLSDATTRTGRARTDTSTRKKTRPLCKSADCSTSPPAPASSNEDPNKGGGDLGKPDPPPPERPPLPPLNAKAADDPPAPVQPPRRPLGGISTSSPAKTEPSSPERERAGRTYSDSKPPSPPRQPRLETSNYTYRKTYDPSAGEEPWSAAARATL